jgi:predicted dehydrogenase
MKRKRCAVVGIGHRSHSWIPQIVTTYKEQVELVALCDPMIQRCHDAGKYFGATAKCYDDYNRMLSEAKPDLVIVIAEKGLTLLNSDNRLIINY